MNPEIFDFHLICLIVENEYKLSNIQGDSLG
jgi:hypothetical protein